MTEATSLKYKVRASQYYWQKSYIFISFCVLLISAWVISAHAPDLFSNYSNFFFLGIVGAIIANSTGAGGGIIFIPAFSALNISSEQALATSILIQCFGMTVGAFKWINGISRSEEANAIEVRTLTKRLIIYSGFSSIIGILLGQHVLSTPEFTVESIFSVFSIIFGIFLILITIMKSFSTQVRLHLGRGDIIVVVLTALVGGIVTSWISIGVGEWLALLLIFRGFPTMLAVAVAVTVSSITVLAGAPFQIINQYVVWEIVLFAAPAAMIGASFARYLAYKLGATRLKMFFALWVIATGFIML